MGYMKKTTCIDANVGTGCGCENTVLYGSNGNL